MPIEISIPDKDIVGFNGYAKTKMEESVSEYATALIEESNRIESGRSNTGNAPEITSSMVNDAKILLGRGLIQPKQKWGIKILRVIASILSLTVGIMYDTAELQDSTYMFLFIAVITAAIFSVTVVTIKE